MSGPLSCICYVAYPACKRVFHEMLMATSFLDACTSCSVSLNQRILSSQSRLRSGFQGSIFVEVGTLDLLSLTATLSLSVADSVCVLQQEGANGYSLLKTLYQGSLKILSKGEPKPRYRPKQRKKEQEILVAQTNRSNVHGNHRVYILRPVMHNKQAA